MSTDLISGKNKYPYVLVFNLLFSFPLYILINNLIYNLFLVLYYGFHPHLLIFATYCGIFERDTIIPAGNKYTLLVSSTIAFKYIIAVVFYYYLRTKSNNSIFVFLLVTSVINIFVFDGYALISYALERYFSLNTFMFFYAGSSIFLLSKKLGLPLFLLPIVNCIFGLILLSYAVPKVFLFGRKRFVFYLLSLAVSSTLIMLLFYIARFAVRSVVSSD